MGLSWPNTVRHSLLLWLTPLPDIARYVLVAQGCLYRRCETVATETMPQSNVGQAKTASSDDYNCPICLCLLHQPVVTSCGHEYCQGCYTQWVAKSGLFSAQPLACPVCRQTLSRSIPGEPCLICSNLNAQPSATDLASTFQRYPTHAGQVSASVWLSS